MTEPASLPFFVGLPGSEDSWVYQLFVKGPQRAHSSEVGMWTCDWDASVIDLPRDQWSETK